MSNFALVGKVNIGNCGKRIGGKAVEDSEVIVGVRADLGEVVVTIDGRHDNLPSLAADTAAQIGSLMVAAAGAASELAAAYTSYQQALQDAEDKLAEALNGGAK
ncbi:hypothetical protein SEA_ELLIE_55 [Mycobacterium phage Ellie]|uniref:Uncharacterized protein n=1 Tax=Mycobacterium phage Ellie TaxID=2762405 RepID=A0A7G8LM08_9CAUD|nr:hypothetical protein I5G88_gp55 [Mycobacterium phage Ellie]QNJ58280.1 hypothetical protein SEA_ELLIE_55 [Mycobacterium phage Ellie]